MPSPFRTRQMTYLISSSEINTRVYDFRVKKQKISKVGRNCCTVTRDGSSEESRVSQRVVVIFGECEVSSLKIDRNHVDRQYATSVERHSRLLSSVDTFYFILTISFGCQTISEVRVQKSVCLTLFCLQRLSGFLA